MEERTRLVFKAFMHVVTAQAWEPVVDYMPPHVKREDQVKKPISLSFGPIVVAQILGVFLVCVTLGCFIDIQIFIELCVRIVHKLLVYITTDPMIKHDTIFAS